MDNIVHLTIKEIQMARSSRSLQQVLKCVELIKTEYAASRKTDVEFAKYLTEKLGTNISVHMVSNYRNSVGIVSNVEANFEALMTLAKMKYEELKLNDAKFAEFASDELGIRVNSNSVGWVRKKLGIPATHPRARVKTPTFKPKPTLTEVHEDLFDRIERKLDAIIRDLNIKVD